ncbi:hypothetical protein RND71_029336 [Anisodus tanguticus]|uniref:Uncharacterized protein n=1 Tax=Anisodus tanguticus TaxID=243964 RepID=A0AAE1REC6_9SOLA|nr:hypothetical protein RND71_029336 [Anisodus tanguticus]
MQWIALPPAPSGRGRFGESVGFLYEPIDSVGISNCMLHICQSVNAISNLPTWNWGMCMVRSYNSKSSPKHYSSRRFRSGIASGKQMKFCYEVLRRR